MWSSARKAGNLLKAGGALAVLGGLVAGLPWTLVRCVGWPLPDHPPSGAEVGAVLTAPLTTGRLLDLLACGAWLIWAWFVADLVRSVLDVIRHVGRPDAGPLSRATAALIAALVVSFAGREAVAQPGVPNQPEAVATAMQRGAPTVQVRPPQAGVHDSLYRIAGRCLGQSNRWPEIWRLNALSVQPGGRTLTSPDLIHPGDRLRLPAEPAPAKPPPIAAHSPPAAIPQAGDPAPSAASWEPEVFVGLGLAAAVSAALLVARRRHRAAYRPGSGRRGDEPPVGPVVRELHLAHRQAETEPEDANPVLGDSTDETAAELALDLARKHGLGFIGPGSPAALRALLLSGMASLDQPDVIAPAADLARLLGLPDPHTRLPDTVDLVDDLTNALDHFGETGQGPRILVAAAPADEGAQIRLRRAVGCEDAIALLLGQWCPGVTIYVDAAGVVTATSPGPGEPLRGRRAFSLPESATHDLLALLSAAHDPQEARQEPDTKSGLEIIGVPERGGTSAPGKPWALSVFGQPRLLWRAAGADPGGTIEITGRLSRRLWELLVYLALHPDGVSRTAIVDSLWADRAPGDPAAALRTVLSRTRAAIEAATSGEAGNFLIAERGRYRLDPSLVEVDYWAFAAALARRRSTTDDRERLAADAAVVDCYKGDLAAGLDAEWLTVVREGVRRDALDAVAALARGHVRDDPESTLQLLETARDFDPYNELLYRDIMRLEHNLGRHDAIARTLSLLGARLAEIDENPSSATVELAGRLRALQVGIIEAAGA